ncbi:MAG: peptidase M23 [Cyanobacteria bacterium P01_E01_bin.48]
MIRVVIAVLVLTMVAAFATTAPDAPNGESAAEIQALAAAQRLAEAAEMLEQADGARNRVSALTETVRAYEQGLASLRDGLRQAAVSETALQDALQTRETEIAQLLGTLSAIERTGVSSFFLHPSGALGTARSGMILSDVAPALETRASELRSELHQIQQFAALQREAAETLRLGLTGVQSARAELSEAVASRTDLPRRFSEDPVKTALLIAASETLTEFAESLDVLAIAEVPGSLPGIDDRRGTLPLPVEGIVQQPSGQSDGPGPETTSLIMAAPSLALVTTPVPATLRYRGPLLDYGNVVILEPQTGILIIMAGLDTVFGEIGQVLPGGSPVGWMPDANAPQQTHADAHLSASEASAGSQGEQTLYIEIRENNIPVDPLTWFAATEG